MTTKVKRRLTTLLCADVEGYSRLMEADEAGTLATLRRYRDAMATLIERHDGHIVNTWGDAIIAEFPSVLEAVKSAVETQQEISSYNGGLPEPQRMIAGAKRSRRRAPGPRPRRAPAARRATSARSQSERADCGPTGDTSGGAGVWGKPVVRLRA